MKSRTIAKLGIIAAIIAAAYFLDTMLSRVIPLLGINLRFAVATISVTLTICQLFDLKTAVFSTTVFGLMSFIMAYIAPTALSVYLIKPYISVLPRMIVGLVSYGVFYGLRKAFAESNNEFLKKRLPAILAGAAGVITNTSLVIGLIALVGGNNILKSLIEVIIAWNFVIELIAGVVLVPLLAARLKDSPSVRALS